MNRPSGARFLVAATIHDAPQHYYPSASLASSSSSPGWTSSNTSDGEEAIPDGAGNATSLPPSSEPPEVWPSVLKSVIFGLIIIGTVVGNLLVCAAIGLTRKLRTASNLLIVSLAVSDLLVGTIDMPFALVNDVMGRWILGQVTCDLWTSIDVLVCTASILNLCMISVDRYLTVTKPFAYAAAVKRAPARIFAMIGLVWVLSTIITVPPLLGWKAAVSKPDQCEVSQDKGYQFFATIGSFYLPLAIMAIVYTRLYRVSSRLAKTDHNNVASASSYYAAAAPNSSLTPNSESVIMAFQQLQLGVDAYDDRGGGGGAGTARNSSSTPATPFPFPPPLLFPSSVSQTPQPRQARSHSLADVLLKMNVRLQRGVRVRVHDRKATRTLGVIMGAFVACWLPFFVLALTKPFVDYPTTTLTLWLDRLFLWLGYTNSLLNPIIYARFNRDFRTPFKCILQCRCANINSRLRSEDFAEQFGRLQVGRSVPPGCLIPDAPTFYDDRLQPPPPRSTMQTRSAPTLNSARSPAGRGSASAFAAAAAAAAAATAVAGGRRAMIPCPPVGGDPPSDGSDDESGVITQFEPGATHFEPGKNQLESGITQSEPGRTQFEPGLTNFGPGRTQFEPGLANFGPGRTQFEPEVNHFGPGVTNSERTQFESEITQLEPGVTNFGTGRTHFEPENTQFEPGATKFEPGRMQLEPGITQFAAVPLSLPAEDEIDVETAAAASDQSEADGLLNGEERTIDQ